MNAPLHVAFCSTILCLSIAATGAKAQDLCADLQAQYRSTIGASGSAGWGEPDRAQLVRQLQGAEQAAQRFNCRGFFFGLGANRSPTCNSILASINRLQQQMGRSGGFPFGLGLDPAAGLRQALIGNGCAVPGKSGGAARTICVRTCDGYYFPISYSAQRSRLKTEASACDSMYAKPGQAVLYTYSANGDVADATSLNGKRYGDQPFAFLYRTAFDASCAAQLKQGIAALGTRYFEARATRLKRAAPVTLSRAQPENRQNPMIPPTLSSATPRTINQPAVAEDNPAPVRIVGPSYYGDVYSVDRMASTEGTSAPRKPEALLAKIGRPDTGGLD